MVGFLDVGGGMKGIYTSGIYDYLMDRGIAPAYCIGVSAGSANLITYIAGQRGRTYRFYHDYAFEKEYMSLSNFLHKGSFIDLHHIYSVLSNEDGRDPLSYDAICASDCRFTAVATDAHTGKPYYLTKSDLHCNDYTVMKASCAMPILGKPINMNGTELFDGGVSDPIPYKKAFSDGCDRLVVCLTNPLSYVKKAIPQWGKRLLAEYPAAAEALLCMHETYNTCMQELFELEKQGKVLLVAPEEQYSISTLTRNKEKLQQLYEAGYRDAQKIIAFL